MHTSTKIAILNINERTISDRYRLQKSSRGIRR